MIFKLRNFYTAIISIEELTNQEKLHLIFSAYDLENTGYLSPDNLVEMIKVEFKIKIRSRI